jgi:hypothetical protein
MMSKRMLQSSPKWDLSVVLRALMGFPFEPNDMVSLKFFTYKTVFLVALATAQRLSELHAFAFVKSAFREGGQVILGFIAGFLAKNQVANASSRPVTILSLSRSVKLV